MITATAPARRRTVSAWNAAPLAHITDTSATLGALSLDALDADTLAGLGAMTAAALSLDPKEHGITEQGRRRLCVCRERVNQAIGRRGGIAAPSRPLSAIIQNPIAHRSSAMTSAPAAGLQAMTMQQPAAGLAGWTSTASTGVGAASRTRNPAAAPGEAAAEGLGSWLSRAIRSIGSNIGSVAGIAASLIPGVGPVIGGAIAAAGTALSSSQQRAAAASTQATSQARSNAQGTTTALVASTAPTYLPTSERPPETPEPGRTFGIENKTLLIGAAVAGVALLAIVAMKK